MAVISEKTPSWILLLFSAPALIFALLCISPSGPSWKGPKTPTTAPASHSPITPRTPSPPATMAALPTLPRQIFNNTLYNRILSHWFGTLPLTATGVDHTTAARWYGMSPPAERAAFDAKCRDIGGEALDALSPARYPLPPWRGFEIERKHALSLSAGLREAVWHDDSNDVTLVEQEHAAAEGRTDDAAKAMYRASIKARALILLLDQFSRNIFRDAAGQALVYSHYDRLARALVHSILDVGGDGGDGGEHSYLVAKLDAAAFAKSPSRRSWFYMPLMHSEDLGDHALYKQRMEGLGAECEGDEEARAWVENGVSFDERHAVILERFGRYPHRNGVLGREATSEEKKWEEEGGESFGTK